MEWTNEICLKLIDEYRSHPSLWDQTSPFYKNKLKRKEAWQMLADRFGCTKAEVERKMNVLLTQYRREKHKILLQSYKDGEVRKSSRWYAFKKFSFMDGGLVTKKCALQLYGAMQMRLGFPGLQTSQVLPNLLWNTSTTTDQTQNPNQQQHQQHDDPKVPHSNINNNNIDNSDNFIKNNNSSVCQPPQDLSMSTQQQQHQQQQQQTPQPISLNNSTTTTTTTDDNQQDEMIEVPIDPKTINNNRLSHQQQLAISNHHKYLQLAQQQTDIQQHYYATSQTDIKNEIFDDTSVHDYYENIDDNDDDDDDIDDFNYNNFQQQNKTLNNNYKRLNKITRRKRVTFNNNQTISPRGDRTSTITSHNNSTTMTAPTTSTTTPLSATLPPLSTSIAPGIDLQSIAERIIKDNDKDDCDFIGCNVAMKLRAMEESQRIIAEKLIADVLFYGQFKELYKTASICPLGSSIIPPSTIATASTTTSTTRTSRENNIDVNL